jgi:hypothetical protein
VLAIFDRTLKPTELLLGGRDPYFALRHLPQQLDQQTYLRVETYKRLSPAQRFILDVTGTESATG